MKTVSTKLSVMGQNKQLLAGGQALGFYSHKKPLNEFEDLEDKWLGLNRQVFSNLWAFSFEFKNLGYDLAGLPQDFLAALQGTHKSVESVYQAAKYKEPFDRQFILSLKDTKEAAYAGRGWLPLDENDYMKCVAAQVEITWVDLEKPNEDPWLEQCRQKLKEMVVRGRISKLPIKFDADGKVAVRSPVLDKSYFKETNLRVMWALLLEKFVLGDFQVESAALQKVASLRCIEGMVEVWPANTHRDEVWTDFAGEGFNTLGMMLFRLVEAVRLDSSTPSDFLRFDSFGGQLKRTQCKLIYEY